MGVSLASPAPPLEYSLWAERIRALHDALQRLAPAAQALGCPPPAGAEWFEHLERKLLPQLSRPPLLVVAVVGGTNIGKSLIFNHLAGEAASGVSPLAAGTRHPVCLTPPGFDDEATLAAIFEGFTLRRWQSQTDALSTEATDCLFWRTGENVPPRLLLLDTPDIDSDAQVNWDRADRIRRTADLLIAVLTQQKYNDAAVKAFFRKAAEVDKPVIVVFNQTDLAEDRPWWLEWLGTFERETGAKAELTYLAPYDRAAAREMRLPFFLMAPSSNGAAGHAPTTGPAAAPAPAGPDYAPASLREELANLRFDAIKIRTFRGAMAQVVDERTGAAAWLEQLRLRSSEFAEAAAALSASQLARVQWPTLPAQVVVEEIRNWWDAQRSGWSRTIHGGYRWLGQTLTWPVRKAWEALGSDQRRDPTESFSAREREAVVFAVQKMLDELERLAKMGNDTLRPRLERLLGGDSRQRLLERVQESHARLPAVDDDYRAFVQSELARWSSENPQVVNVLRSLDYAAALARPAITVTLCVSGWIVAGSLMHEAAVHAATHTATGLATEAAITGGIAGGGEMVVNAAHEGISAGAARLFSRLQTRYAELRANWLAHWLEQELLGDLLGQLRTGAEVPQLAAFLSAGEALRALRQSTR